MLFFDKSQQPLATQTSNTIGGARELYVLVFGEALWFQVFEIVANGLSEGVGLAAFPSAWRPTRTGSTYIGSVGYCPASLLATQGCGRARALLMGSCRTIRTLRQINFGLLFPTPPF